MNFFQLASVVLTAVLLAGGGCAKPAAPYGIEQQLSLASGSRQIWAVAPTIDLSGKNVDPLLQGDLLFQQLQQVDGLTVIPVNRVVEVYSSLGINRVQSEDQAKVVCDLLGADALVVATVSIFDPYNPPKMGASLQLLRARSGNGAIPAAEVNPREMMRQAAPDPNASAPTPTQSNFSQAVGMFDAANGSVRQAVFDYAAGRNDPVGPMGANEYLMSMDRYSGFVYHQLIVDLLRSQVQ